MSRNQLLDHVRTMILNGIEEEEQHIMLLLEMLMKEEDVDIQIAVACTNRQHRRISGYTEQWLPRYLDYDFYSLYRMTKKTFNALLTALNCPEKSYMGGNEPILMEKALLMTLSWLGKGETLIRISEIFNVAISTVYCCTEFMIRKLLLLQRKIICWPTEEEREKIERDFRGRCNFPGVIGAIDVCNIQFKAPAEHQESYIDKNKNHSIKLQAIVTCDKIFTSIMVGYPGSAHDSRVFRNSKLYLDVEENERYRMYFNNDDYHLVGDKAYPLKKWIMTPFKDNGRLTNQHRLYNTRHSSTRIVVEHTFGLLKSRWRILQRVNVNSIEKAVMVIAVCCIMHNFYFINYDFLEQYAVLEHDDVEYENANDIPEIAVNKRLEIMNSL